MRLKEQRLNLTKQQAMGLRVEVSESVPTESVCVGAPSGPVSSTSCRVIACNCVCLNHKFTTIEITYIVI